MKRVAVVAVACAVALGLTGCELQMSEETMRTIASARDACEELGGTFYQWTGLFTEEWSCEFDTDGN